MKRLLMFMLMATILSITSWGQNTAPLNEGFESGIPDTWTHINGSSENGWEVSSGYSHSGSKSMFAQYGYSDIQNCYLITPGLVPASSSDTLAFWVMTPYANYTYSTSLTVEVSTTNTDTSSFTSIATITLPSSSYTWERRTVDLSAYNGQTIYIAFHLIDNNGAGVYLDDVSGVESIVPACTKPSDIVIDALSDQATITWTSTGSDFEIYYKENSATDYNPAITTFSAGSEDNTWTTTLSNLNSATGYDVYIKALCDDNTELQSNTLSFYTPMISADLPYSTDFSGDATTGDTNWLFRNHTSTTHWVFGTINSDTTAMFLTSDGTTPGYLLTSETRVSAEKVFNAVENEQLHIEFDIKAGGESNYDYLKVFLTSGDWTFPASASESTYSGYSYSTNALSFADYLSQTGYTSYPYKINLTQGNYIHYSMDVTNPVQSTDGTIKLTFVWKNDPSYGTQPGAIIRNLSISPVVCTMPALADIVISDIYGHTATITMPEGSSYTVDYKTTAEEDWTAATMNDNVASLSGLLPETTYQIRVAKVCDAGNSAYEYKTFTTDVACPTPIATVDSITSDMAVLSWTGSGDSYTVRYKPASSDTWSEETATDNTITLENLISATLYNVTITADCGSEDGLSEAESLSFTTKMIAVDLPYVTDFSGAETTGDTNWLFQNHTSTNRWVFGTINTDTTAMFISQDGTTPGYGNSQTRVSAEKLFNSVENEKIRVEFDVKIEGENYWDFLKVFLTSGDWTFPASASESTYSGYSYSTNALSFADYLSQTGYAYYPYKFSLTQGNYIHYSAEVTNPVQSTDGTIKLTFVWRNDSYGSYSPGAIIRNVSITPVACPTPTGSIVANAITGHTATLTMPEGHDYVFEYKTSTDETWQTAADVDSNVAHLSGLTPETSYQVRVTTNCGTNGLSAGSLTGSFTTTVACPAPTITIDSFTTTTATLSWVGDADSYTVRYKISSASDWEEETVNGANYTTIENLTPSTFYNVEVIANCGEDGTSVAGTNNFRTECVTVTEFPYMEDFETLSSGDLGCWTNENVAGTTAWTIVSSTTGKVAYRSYYSGAVSRLISPVMDITSLTSPYVSYNWEVCNDGANYDSLYVYYRTSESEDWTLLVSHGPSHSGSLSGYVPTQDTTIALPNPSATYQISFLAVGHNGYGLYLDNVYVQNISCDGPTSLTVNNITSSSADVVWEGNASVLEYRVAGSEQWQNESITTSPYTMQSLTPQTSYEVRIGMQCLDGTVTHYPETITFTTSMIAVDLPYSTDFSGDATTGDTNWLFQNHTSTNHWVFGTINSDTTAMFISQDGTTPGYAILDATTRVSVEKVFNSVENEQLHIEFDIKAGGESSCDYLKVFLTSADWTFPASSSESTYSSYSYSTNALSFAEYLSQTGYSSYPYKLNLTQGDYIHYSMDVTNPVQSSDGAIKLTFVWKNDGSVGTQPGAIIRNLSITPSVCPMPSIADISVSDITGHTATITLPSSENTYVVEYKLETETDWTEATMNDNIASLSGLVPETEYQVRVATSCSEGNSAYKIITFTTGIACNVPVASLGEVTDATATISWIGDATSYIVRYKSASSDTWTEETVNNDYTITLQGLTSNTLYNVEVKADCGTEDGLSAAAVLSFRTRMVAVDLPYVTDFSGDETTGDTNWLFKKPTSTSNTTQWAFGTIGTDTTAMFVTQDGTTPGYYESSATRVSAEKIFNSVENEQLHIEFDVKVGGESSYDYLKVFLTDTSWNFTATASESTYSTYSYSTNALSFADYLSQTGYTSYPYKINLTQGNYIHYSMDVANPVQSSDGTIKLTFVWKNDPSYGTQPGAIIRNLSITPAACPSPLLANINISNITGHTATITMPEGQEYVIEYKTATDEDWTPATMDDNVANLSGLTPETEYQVRVALVCDEGNSAYTSTTFTTDVACPVPVVTVDGTTATSATLSWTGSADSYTVRYTQTTSDSWTEETVTDNTITLENLADASSYSVEVIANCGTLDGNSDTATASFFTQMISVDLPYSTDFSGTANTGDTAWLLRTPASTSNTTHWVFGSVSTDTTAMFVTSDGTTPGYNVSSQTRLSAEKVFNTGSSSQLHIEFDVKVGGEASGQYAYDYLKVLLSDGTWTFPISASENTYSYYTDSTYALSFADYLSQTGYTSYPYKINLTQGNYIHYSADIDNPNPNGTVKLTFVWKNDYSGGTQPGAIVRNVSISEVGGSVVTPVEPTVATNVASNISQTSATLNGEITDAGNQTITAKGFEWKATNGGTYAQVLSADNGNTLTYNLTNLTANTSYTYKAFASTANGTVYGTEQVFTTLSSGDEPCTPLTASVTETLCYGESFTFNGQTYNATGTYTTTVAGQNGDCDTLYTINLTILPQNEPINEEITISQSELPYEYHGETYNDFGTYSVTTQDENGCDQVYNLTLVHNSGISEVEGGLTISLYPNPTDNNATLRVKGLNEQATIIITDQQGRVVSTKVLAEGVEIMEIESEKLASGVYYIRIQTATTIRTEKLIKK